MEARLITQIGTFVSLRRYHTDWGREGEGSRVRCPDPRNGGGGPWGYHDARALIDILPRVFRTSIPRGPDGPWEEGPDWAEFLRVTDPKTYAGDPRWPTFCPCGYEFAPEDPYQVFPEAQYDTEDGYPWTGDMCWADWYEPPHLHAYLPDGSLWDIDGPSRNGGGWQRSGEPPRVTVTPSILVAGYHGFLTEGVFTPDLDAGRTYERRSLAR